MKWSKRLFFGEKASRQKFKLMKSVNKRSLTPFLYIVAIADGKLCIFSQVLFNNLYNVKEGLIKRIFRKKNDKNDVLILGLAISKYEAHSLIRDIVEEVYLKTGGFEYKTYFERNEV